MQFQYTFIGFTDFEYLRCKVDICNDTAGHFNESFVHFAIPKSDDEKIRACYVYDVIDAKAGCKAENFNMNASVLCSEHVYDSENIPYQLSFARELDLPGCETDWPLGVTQMSLINMAYMLGLLIGSLLFGLLSDKFGRRKALLLAALLSGALSLSMSFLKNYWAYLFLRLLLGISAKGLFMLAFMVCVEVSGVDYKTSLGILIQVPFALGEMLVALVAYSAQNWDTLQQIMSGSVLGLILVWYWMPESPRWLLSKIRYQKALKVLTIGSRLNRRALPEGFLLYDNEGILSQVYYSLLESIIIFLTFMSFSVTRKRKNWA